MVFVMLMTILILHVQLPIEVHRIPSIRVNHVLKSISGMDPACEETTDGGARVWVNFGPDHLGQSFNFKDDLVEDIFESASLPELEDLAQRLCQDNVHDCQNGLSLPGFHPSLKVFHPKV